MACNENSCVTYTVCACLWCGMQTADLLTCSLVFESTASNAIACVLVETTLVSVCDRQPANPVIPPCSTSSERREPIQH